MLCNQGQAPMKAEAKLPGALRSSYFRRPFTFTADKMLKRPSEPWKSHRWAFSLHPISPFPPAQLLKRMKQEQTDMQCERKSKWHILTQSNFQLNKL